MRGTESAASLEFTVTRTSSEPARARDFTCAAVVSTSAVSVFVIDWTTMGFDPPTRTEPIETVRLRRRMGADMAPFYPAGRSNGLRGLLAGIMLALDRSGLPGERAAGRLPSAASRPARRRRKSRPETLRQQYGRPGRCREPILKRRKPPRRALESGGHSSRGVLPPKGCGAGGV